MKNENFKRTKGLATAVFRIPEPSIAGTASSADSPASLCVLCGDNQPDLVDVQRGYRIVECRKCGLVYLDPPPLPAFLVQSYQAYLPDDPDGVANWNRMMDGLYRSARRRLIARFPAGGRLLDVGCAYGGFLEMMKKAGWQVEGIEVAAAAAAACRRRELDVHAVALAEAQWPADRFDAVTLFYVLEHVPDPLGGLRKIYEAMKPGGLLIVRVPDTTPLAKFLKRIGRRNELYDPPYHLFDFSPAVLTRLIEQAGFRNVRMEIDAATRPRRIGPRLLSLTATMIGRALQWLTGGRFLLRGVSKTAVAEK
ncbi:MAG: class I SAM-dependent methyltransferase [Candidatus Sumerlaeia bacterium]|nr:class I SAM-dependent methyltransferase [Candidatus Sumerlaeia bacterium]